MYPFTGDLVVRDALINTRGFVCFLVFPDAVDDLPARRIGHSGHVLAKLLDVLAIPSQRRRSFVFQGEGFFDLCIDHFLEVCAACELKIWHLKSLACLIPWGPASSPNVLNIRRAIPQKTRGVLQNMGINA